MGMTEAIVAGVVGILLARQIEASIPRLIDRVLRYAVKRLPEHLQTRYHEEWSSHLEDTPGDLAKLISALDLIRASRAIRLDRKRRALRMSFSKNLLDKIAATIILVAILPLLLVLSALIKLDSRGPVLLRQKRYGFNNEVIEIFKFRSMYIDRREDDVVTKAALYDPRVTRIGRILRRTSLDELPQFLNVLMGTMSIVGPRPHAIAPDEQYALLMNKYLAGHGLKPGITGWARVNGLRGETRSVRKMEQWVRFERYYIENWSLWLDLRIIWQTLWIGWLYTDDGLDPLRNRLAGNWKRVIKWLTKNGRKR